MNGASAAAFADSAAPSLPDGIWTGPHQIATAQQAEAGWNRQAAAARSKRVAAWLKRPHVSRGGETQEAGGHNMQILYIIVERQNNGSFTDRRSELP